MDNLEYKELLNGSAVLSDDAHGIVEAIVSVTGKPDHVNDVIMPGAYVQTLKERTPKGVWHHDWKTPIAKTLEIKELMPGDPALPNELPSGEPWPNGCGGLYVKMQFNLDTQVGRDAYSNVKFYGATGEWCVDEDTEILTKRGWLRYDELTTDDKAYALDHETGLASFVDVTAVNVFANKTRQMRHIKLGDFDSLTTSDHNWPLVEQHGERVWTKTRDLTNSSLIPRVAPRCDAPIDNAYSDAFVGSVARYWVDGWSHDGHASSQLLSCVDDNRVPTIDFLLSLTQGQLDLLVNACIDADGTQPQSGQTAWYQVNQVSVDRFTIACALAGVATNIQPHRAVSADTIVEHTGRVWCPTTATGTWFARRNGSTYFTGNSIGFKTGERDFTRKNGLRYIRKLNLFEYSPVLFGASSDTTTLSVKQFDDVDEGIVSLTELLTKGMPTMGPDGDMKETITKVIEMLQGLVDGAQEDAAPEDATETPEDTGAAPVVEKASTTYVDTKAGEYKTVAEAVEAISEDIDEEDKTELLNAAKEYDAADDASRDEAGSELADIIDELISATDNQVLIDQLRVVGRTAANAYKGVASVGGEEGVKAMIYTMGALEVKDLFTELNVTSRDIGMRVLVKAAMNRDMEALGAAGNAFKNANGEWSYPIENTSDLKNAIQAVGRAIPSDREKLIAYISSHAEKMGMSDILPSEWTKKEGAQETEMIKADDLALELKDFLSSFDA